MKEYSNREEVRAERSNRLKIRYSNGDILSPEVRKRVAKAGNEGWVSKIKSCDFDTRRELLHNFVSAGNESQAERRSELTPEDYNRLYPFAKGKARYHNCDFCGKQMIAWFGGKPRPKKRFCNQACHHDYLQLHPHSTLPQTRLYYSRQMGVEFCLHSRLEEWIAKIFDDNCLTWCTPPFYIGYDYLGKSRRYYPDFFVNGHYVIEVKSSYILALQGEDRTRYKFMSAESFCGSNGYEFIYWQFDGLKSQEDVERDSRIMEFLNGEVCDDHVG